MVKFKKGCKPELVTQELQKTVRRNNEGQISFDALHFENFSRILCCMLNDVDDVPEVEISRFMTKALFAVTKHDILEPGAIVRALSSELDAYYKLDCVKFDIVTSISIAKNIVMPRLIVNDCQVEFCKDLHEKYVEAREHLLNDAKYNLFGVYPEDYMFVVVSVHARSESEAFERAIRCLDFVRAIWNYAIGYSAVSAFDIGKRYPINQILLGPVHTVHNEDGKCEKDVWWYDPDYVEPIKPINSKKMILKMMQLYNKMFAMLKVSNYKSVLESILIRYVSALDLRNYGSSFVLLWGVLESLTDGKNHEEVISRASASHSAVDFARQELRLLLHFRNGFAHEGKGSSFTGTLLYRLKYYCDVLIRIHLANKSFFSSVEEFGSFLSCATEPSTIDKQLRILKKARSFVS